MSEDEYSQLYLDLKKRLLTLRVLTNQSNLNDQARENVMAYLNKLLIDLDQRRVDGRNFAVIEYAIERIEKDGI